MTKTDQYRPVLRQMDDWDAYLLRESGLPGPRGNLELLQAVADEGDASLFERYLQYSPKQAPTNDPKEFLVGCGIVGLGKLVSQGKMEWMPILRTFASDPRWRVREAVAMALQRFGDADMSALIAEMSVWAEGNPFEQRAAAAALCEPRLLKDPGQVRCVLEILDRITGAIQPGTRRKTEAFQALKKGLGYCWSVAVAALPETGQPMMEKWLVCGDPDITWIMKENLKKNRLIRLNLKWNVAH